MPQIQDKIAHQIRMQSTVPGLEELVAKVKDRPVLLLLDAVVWVGLHRTRLLVLQPLLNVGARQIDASRGRPPCDEICEKKRHHL